MCLASPFNSGTYTYLPLQVREGFIVEDEEEPEERERRKREKKKRRRAEREEEEADLDEEDLDLIGEAIPGFERRAPSEVRLYHVSTGHRLLIQ